MTEHDRYYRALVSRDPRFDGRFFAAVRTTGVYCRPICPAPKPKACNVEIFASAAAAERAGYRACRRCRPDRAPTSAAWRGSSTLRRAMLLIDRGALDSGRVPELAARLGVGDRQLRRVFDRCLGASPAAVARTRRVHFARRLIDDTEIPMADVAAASGFRSLRRFNHEIRQAFGASPTLLRSRRPPRGHSTPGAADRFVLRLAYRPPFDWDAVLDFLRPRAIPGVERVDGSSYRRTVRLHEDEYVLEVRSDPGRRELLVGLPLHAARHLVHVVERARAIFDLDADSDVIATHLRQDAGLARRVDAVPGVRVPGSWDGFELAVRAILGQQVTVKGATTLAGRLVRAHGVPVGNALEPGLDHHFPTPARLADADLRAAGLPEARARTIRALARKVRDGDLALEAGHDSKASLARLREIPGIGPWTQHYIAMRVFAEPDAFPASDLGLRRALSRGGALISAKTLESAAESWRPWRAYAAMVLWRTAA